MNGKTIAIFEFVCGGGFLNQSLAEIPESLLEEGRSMLAAIAGDWAKISGWQVRICWDSRLGAFEVPSDVSNIDAILIPPNSDYWEHWTRIGQQADVALVIAPEINDELRKAVSILRRAGVELINADDRFLETTSDKWRTSKAFEQGQLLHPVTYLFSEIRSDLHDANIDKLLDDSDGIVVKPRDGAGCHGIRRLKSRAEFESFVSSVESNHDQWVIQSWLYGHPGSVVVLCGPSQRVVLPPMTQEFSWTSAKLGQTPVYVGGRGPWLDSDGEAVTRFAKSVISAIPGEPLGWIGIDFLKYTDRFDQLIFAAIEINPRLTTSYIGLRSVVQENLAELIWQTYNDRPESVTLTGKMESFRCMSESDRSKLQ